MDFTCVEIKNVKYIKLLPLDHKGRKELELTTIHRDQELAYMNIYLIDNNKNKKLMKCINIENIHPGNSGIPELHLSVSYDGMRYYKIVLKLNGYMYHNSIIDIKQFRKSGNKITNIVLVALALIILSFLTFFSISTFKNNNRDTRSTEVVMNTTTDQTTTDQTTTDQTTITSALIDNQAVVYFYPDSSSLTIEAKSVLDEILEILNNNGNLDVVISGHCAFYGTEKGRQEISTERAQSVYSYFISKEWTPDTQPELAGLGLEQIVTKDPDKQDLNRRVEIIIKSN